MELWPQIWWNLLLLQMQLRQIKFLENLNSKFWIIENPSEILANSTWFQINFLSFLVLTVKISYSVFFDVSIAFVVEALTSPLVIVTLFFSIPSTSSQFIAFCWIFVETSSYSLFLEQLKISRTLLDSVHFILNSNRNLFNLHSFKFKQEIFDCYTLLLQHLNIHKINTSRFRANLKANILMQKILLRWELRRQKLWSRFGISSYRNGEFTRHIWAFALDCVVWLWFHKDIQAMVRRRLELDKPH